MTIPGIVTAFENKEDGSFMYIFVSFAACIERWLHSRQVISVDGTFLKNKYVRTLLIASWMDGNNHILPLPFGIVDSETDAYWEWFLQKLKGAIPYCEDLVLVSDWKSSILRQYRMSFHMHNMVFVSSIYWVI